MNKTSTTFQTYRDKQGTFRWRALRAGRIVADSGEGYNRLAVCQRSLRRVLDSIKANRVQFAHQEDAPEKPTPETK